MKEERELAEKRAKILDEFDEEIVDEGVKQEAGHVSKKYSSTDLEG